MAETAKEYAGALFSLAKEANLLDEILASLTETQSIFEADPEYLRFLSVPGIPKTERIGALQEAFADRPELTLSFLSILVEHNIIGEFERCVKEFTLLYQDEKARATAYVTSAAALTDGQIQRLKAKLQKQSGREVELVCTVDPSLLAGVRVQLDETVFDGSIKKRLQNIKEEIIT